MSEFTFVCPYCRTSLTADDSERGLKFDCPSCSSGLIVPREAAADDGNDPEGQSFAASTTSGDTNPSAPKGTPRQPTPAPSTPRELTDAARDRIRGILQVLGGVVMVTAVLLGGAAKQKQTEELRDKADRFQYREIDEAARAQAKQDEGVWLVCGFLGLIVMAVGKWGISDSTQKQAAVWQANERKKKEQEAFNRKVREHPNECPSCGSQDVSVYFPSKPRVWAPVDLSGIILLAASSAAADAIYKPEKVCSKCGQRWPAPEYE